MAKIRGKLWPVALVAGLFTIQAQADVAVCTIYFGMHYDNSGAVWDYIYPSSGDGGASSHQECLKRESFCNSNPGECTFRWGT